jgi:hypothetical protein
VKINRTKIDDDDEIENTADGEKVRTINPKVNFSTTYSTTHRKKRKTSKMI